jgi:hypothetical protein
MASLREKTENEKMWFARIENIIELEKCKLNWGNVWKGVRKQTPSYQAYLRNST